MEILSNLLAMASATAYQTHTQKKKLSAGMIDKNIQRVPPQKEGTMPAPRSSGIRNLGAEDVPFVYFDAVLAFGMYGGIVQVELAAKVLDVNGKGELKN